MVECGPPSPPWFMRGQHQWEPGWGKRKVAEDKSLAYFFFTVIYGNVCRQSGAMNGIWWSQGWRANVEPPVMNLDLLTREQVVKLGADRGLLSIYSILGPAELLHLFKAVPRRSLALQKKWSHSSFEIVVISDDLLSLRIVDLPPCVEVMILRHSCWGMMMGTSHNFHSAAVFQATGLSLKKLWKSGWKCFFVDLRFRCGIMTCSDFF